MDAEEAEEITRGLAQVHAGGYRLTLAMWRQGVPEAMGLTLPEWQERLGGYIRLSIPERKEAARELDSEGLTQREIASVLGVGQATVHRDLDDPHESSGDDSDTETEGVPDPHESAEPEEVTEVVDLEEAEQAADQDHPLVPLSPGWHDLGPHRLYCGDSTDAEFIDACGGTAFAFADPPYNAGKATWDQDFRWKHDYLSDQAEIVAVTPGIASLAGFLSATDMPYRWSMAAEITNGMTAGPLRFSNWICVTLFADGTIYRKAKDHLRIPAATGDDDGGSHPSRKPIRLLTHLIELFTTMGDTVVDPFLGSGTTLIAAERTGRRCVGAEIDPTYCAEIATRWKQATG